MTMNILHLSRTMGYGGAQKIVYELATGCKERGHHIVVVSGDGVYVDMLQEADIPHYEVCDLESKNFWNICKTLKSLIMIVKKEKIEVVHTHHRMAAIYGNLLRWIFPDIKLVYTAHNVFYNKKVFTRFGLRSSEIVAVGKNVKHNLEDYFDIDGSRIHIIYNAVETMVNECSDKTIEQWRSAGNILVGTVGRITEQKGTDIFVKAFAEAKKSQPLLKGIIIGDGELREEVETLIGILELKDDIYMMGYQDNVAYLMKQLSFAVMPSRWEGFPLTPLELFSVGKTLIASDIVGINEIVENNKNGILVRKNDWKTLAREIVDLANDSEKRKRLENAGKEFYYKNMDYDKFIEQYIDLYEKIGE